MVGTVLRQATASVWRAAGPSSSAAAATGTRITTTSRAAMRGFEVQTSMSAPQTLSRASRAFSATARRAADNDATSEAGSSKASTTAQGQAGPSSSTAATPAAGPPPRAMNPWAQLQQSIQSERIRLQSPMRMPGSVESTDGHVAPFEGNEEEEFERYWQQRSLFGTNLNDGGAQGAAASGSGGRVVQIDGRVMNVTKAMGLLNGVVRRNGLRREMQQQAFYEKPNQLRRRLASERHRRRFANLVREKVKLVMELKQKGA